MDWNKIKQEYISSGASYRKLADKYGVSISTLSKRASKEKWSELKDAAEQECNSELIKSVGKKQAKRIERMLTVTDKMLDKIEMIVDSLSAEELMPSIKMIAGAIKDIKDVQKSGCDAREQEARITRLEREIEGSAFQNCNLEDFI